MEAKSPSLTKKTKFPLPPATSDELECRGMEPCSPNDSSGLRGLTSVNNDSGFDGEICVTEVAGHTLTTDANSNEDERCGGTESVFDLGNDKSSLHLTEGSEFETYTKAEEEFSCHDDVVRKMVECYELNLRKVKMLNKVEARLHSANKAECNVEESTKVHIVRKEVESYEQSLGKLKLMNDVEVDQSDQLPCDDGSQTNNQSDQLPCDDGSQTINQSDQLPCDDGSQTINQSDELPCDDGSQTINQPDQLPCDDGSQTINQSDELPCDDGSQTINQPDQLPCDDGSLLRNVPSFAQSHDTAKILFRSGPSIESAPAAAGVTQLDAMSDFWTTCVTSDQIPCDTDTHLTNMVPDSPPRDIVFPVTDNTSIQTSVEIRLPLPKVGSCASELLGPVEPGVMMVENGSCAAHTTTKVVKDKKPQLARSKKTAKAQTCDTKAFSSEKPTADLLLNLWSGPPPISKFVLVWPSFLPKEQHTASQILCYSGKSSGMKFSVRGRAPNFYAVLGSVQAGGMTCETIEIARDKLAEKLLRDLSSRCCLLILSKSQLVDGSSACNVTTIHRNSEIWINAPSFGRRGIKWEATIETQPGKDSIGPLVGATANGNISDTFKLKIRSVIGLFEHEVKTGQILSDTLHLNLGLSRREAAAVCTMAVQRGLLASFRGRRNDLSVKIQLETTVRERLLWAVQRNDDRNNFTLSLPGTYSFEKMLYGETLKVNFPTKSKKVHAKKVNIGGGNKTVDQARRGSRKSNARAAGVDSVEPDLPAPPNVVPMHRVLSPHNARAKRNAPAMVSQNVEKPACKSETTPVMEYTKNLRCADSKKTKQNLRTESTCSLEIVVDQIKPATAEHVHCGAAQEVEDSGVRIQPSVIERHSLKSAMAEHVPCGTPQDVEDSGIQIQPSVTGRHSLDFFNKSEREKLSIESVEPETGVSLIIDHTPTTFDFADDQICEGFPINDDGCTILEGKMYNKLTQSYEQSDVRIEHHSLFSDEVATTPTTKRPLDEHFFHPVTSCNLSGRGLCRKKLCVSPTVHVSPQSGKEQLANDKTAKNFCSSAVNSIESVFPENSLTARQLQKLWTDFNPLAKLVLVHRPYLPKQSALQILTFSCNISGMPFGVESKGGDSTAFIGDIVVGMTKKKSKKEARRHFSESLLQQLCSCCCLLELKEPNWAKVPLTTTRRVLSGIEFWRQLAIHKNVASKASQRNENEEVPAPKVPQTLHLPGLSGVNLSFQKEITQIVRQFQDDVENGQNVEEELLLNLGLSAVEAKIVDITAKQHNLQAEIVDEKQACSVVIKASTTVRNKLLLALRFGETDHFDLCLPGTYSVEKFAAAHPKAFSCRHNGDVVKGSAQCTGSPPADHSKTNHLTFIHEDIQKVWSDSNPLPSLTLVHRNYKTLDPSVPFEEDLINFSARLSGVCVSVQKDSTPECFTVYMNGKPVGRSYCRSLKEAKASIFTDILPKLCSRCSLVVLTKPLQECTLVVTAKELLENDIAPTTLPSIDSNNVGYKLLKMMGWSGGGLGREAAGRTEPLQATEPSILPDRRGLGFPPPFASPTDAKVDALLRDFTKGVKICGALYDKIKFTQGFSKERRNFINKTAQKYRLKYTILDDKNFEVSKPLSVSQVIAEAQRTEGHDIYVPGSYDVSILYNSQTSADSNSQAISPTTECRSNFSNFPFEASKVDLPLDETDPDLCSATSRQKHSATVCAELPQEPCDPKTSSKISDTVQVSTKPAPPLLDEILKVWSTADPLSKLVIVNRVYEETKEDRAFEIMSYSGTVSNLPFSVVMTAANECSAFLGDILVGVLECTTAKLANKLFSEKLLQQFCSKCCFLELRKPLSSQKYLTGSKVFRLKDGDWKTDLICDREHGLGGNLINDQVLLEESCRIPSNGEKKTPKTFDKATDVDHLERSRLDRASEIFEVKVTKTIEEFLINNETSSTLYKYLAFALPLSDEKMRVIKTAAEKFQLKTKISGKLNAERIKIKMPENIRVVLLGLLKSDKQVDDFSLHLPGTYNTGNILTESNPPSVKGCTVMPEGNDGKHEVSPGDPNSITTLQQ